MSFRCGLCADLSSPCEPASVVVVERRPRSYVCEDGREARGWEIAREVKAHARCALQHANDSARVV